MPSVYSREEVRDSLEGMDHVKCVGDTGTGLMAQQEPADGREQTFGGFVRTTGWVPVATVDSGRVVIFAPYGEVRE